MLLPSAEAIRVFSSRSRGAKTLTVDWQVGCKAETAPVQISAVLNVTRMVLFAARTSDFLLGNT